MTSMLEARKIQGSIGQVPVELEVNGAAGTWRVTVREPGTGNAFTAVVNSRTDAEDVARPMAGKVLEIQAARAHVRELEQEIVAFVGDLTSRARLARGEKDDDEPPF